MLLIGFSVLVQTALVENFCVVAESFCINVCIDHQIDGFLI